MALGVAAPPSVSGQNDPYLVRHASRIEDELNNLGKNTNRLVRRAGQEVRNLGAGQMSEAESRARRQGRQLTPLEAARIRKDTQENVAGVTADVRLGEEDKRFERLFGATESLKAPGESGRDSAALGLDAWKAAQEAQVQREAMRLQEERDKLDAFMSQFNMLGAASSIPAIPASPAMPAAPRSTGFRLGAARPAASTNTSSFAVNRSGSGGMNVGFR